MPPTSYPHRAQTHSPQHIAEILPDVLARYGLGPQAAESGARERPGGGRAGVLELPVLELTADFALPLSLS